MAVPAYVDSLIAARAALVQQLQELAEAGPLINHSLDGQSVDFSATMSMLTDKIEALNKLIAQGNQPFWRVSKARP